MSNLIVQVARIEKIESHPNADKLEILQVLGWNVVEKKDRFKVGESVVFFPPDSILPVELSDRLNCTQYLYKQRLRAARLRGFVSCGLVAPNEGNWEIGQDLTEHYGIAKYEAPEPSYNAGTGGQNIKEVGLFHYYTNIDNWNNYPNILIPDEEVVIVEKLHGTNARFGLIEDEFFVGSHHRTKYKDEKIVYWEAALTYDIENLMRKHLPSSRAWILFGEIFGKVQNLRYGLGQGIALRLFDISQNGKYLDYDEFENFAWIMGLPTAPLLYCGPYSVKLLTELSEGKAFQGDHVKEGCVVRPVKERFNSKIHRVILKKINPEYLVSKNLTEYH